MAKEKDWDNVYKDLEKKWEKEAILDDKKKMANINKQLEKNAEFFDKYGKKVEEKEGKYPTILAKDGNTKVVSGVTGAKAIQDVEIHNKVGKLPVGNNVKDAVKTCDLVDADVDQKQYQKKIAKKK